MCNRPFLQIPGSSSRCVTLTVQMAASGPSVCPADLLALLVSTPSLHVLLICYTLKSGVTAFTSFSSSIPPFFPPPPSLLFLHFVFKVDFVTHLSVSLNTCVETSVYGH